MTRSSTGGRLQRLESLAAHLKEDRHYTMQDLADLQGVSARTIARDLSLMREQGMQIDADRGRGGGLRLDRTWGVGRINLDYAEAVDLLISIAVAEKMNSPLFLANLASVRRKLIASFSKGKRDRVDWLKTRILIGKTASTYVQAGLAAPAGRVVRTLHRAFVEQESLQIGYRREDGSESQRVIEPHFLLLKYPVWYVIAMDDLRGAPRVFRCDRILSAEPAGRWFKLAPKDSFETAFKDDDLPW